MGVLSRSLADQPIDPALGAAYIIPPNAQGNEWSQFPQDHIALFIDGEWTAIPPREGMIATQADTGITARYVNGAWADILAPHGLMLTDTMPPQMSFSSSKFHFARLIPFVQFENGPPLTTHSDAYIQHWLASHRDAAQAGNTSIVWLKADSYSGDGLISRVGLYCENTGDRLAADRIKTLFADTYTYTPYYDLEASNDGENWTSLLEVRPTTDMTERDMTFSSPKAYRYWAIRFITDGANFSANTEANWIGLMNMSLFLS